VGVVVRSATLKDNSNVIYLKSSLRNLDEIVVSRQHPQKILRSLVENSKNKLTVPARLKVYSREFFKLNGGYSYYNDGLLNFLIDNKAKVFKTNILVEQNRSYGLMNTENSSDLLGYNLNNIMENYYNFKYLNSLLTPEAKKKYEFLVKAYSSNEQYYAMIISPIEEGADLRDDFTIIYDKSKKIIIEVSSVVSPSTFARAIEKKAVGSRNINKSFFKAIYRSDEVGYYLLSSREEIGFERIDKNKSTEIEVKNYFVTTNFNKQSFSYKEYELFKDKTLINKKNSILTNYWDVSGLTTTQEEEEIIKKIEVTN
jgi:hypothetical protein